MKKQKLNYRFHNPNTAEAAAEYIARIFVEVNLNKIEKLLQESEPPQQKTENTEGAAE